MEAAAVSAAVSVMLKIVGNKLAPLAIKEYSSIVGVEKDLQELLDLAEQINHWLETAGDRAMGDAPSFNWLKNLKDVAYDVDDVVDEFQSEAEKHNTYGDDFIVSKKTKSVISRLQAAKKIKEIKKRFAAIVKQRTDVSAIANCFSAGQSVHHMNQTTVDITLPIVDAASVLGRDQDKRKIITYLVETKDQQEIEIVSVIGLGGSGKTTLAKLVLNDGDIIEKHFEVRVWVHVSEEFNVIKLVEKLFEATTEDKSDHRPLQHMSKKILEKLTGKRFLLVLDDVWTDDRIHWKEFMVHLKSGASGSKILLTTRSTRVAKAVDSKVLFDLPLLSLDDSWQLFARSFGAGVTGLGSDFQVVGKEIVEKCGGVPLGIIVLASVLRDKERIEEWQAMKDNNLLDVEGKEHRIFACLKLSYFHLPSHLKPCFTICSLFPKGYMIDKEQLIDLWIAHDMIAGEDGVNYLEYIAQKHFNSLVQMSLLQDVGEDHYGRVECRMHDLVHDLARSILDDEISLDVAKKKTNFTKTHRYFSLIEESTNPLPENLFKKARAVYVAKLKNGGFDKAWKNAKHLRSINVNYIHTESVLTAILQIQNLRYLEVRQLKCEALPEAISNIWSLQALHLPYSDLLELPKSIGKLQKLRTLNLLWCEKLTCLPDSIGDCQIISTIDLSYCKKLAVLPNSIGRNEKLRVLRLRWTQIERLPSSVTALRNLECLDLCHCWSLLELPEGIGNLEKLQVLNLEGCENLGGMPNSIGRNEKLRVLRLGCTQIERLPSSVTALRNLECLDLRWCWRLVELPEGIGNLEKLQVLNLEGCTNLGGMPAGIGQLSRLQKLGLFVAGEGEKFAGISELANLPRIGGGLSIIDISHGMDPANARMACLKQNTNLRRLDLQWMTNDAGEVNNEMVENALDGLEPPSGLKELEIGGYSGKRYARWMHNQVVGGVQGLPYFPFLRMIQLRNFPNLKHLHGLAELPCLLELELRNMPSLESISGGPFPSLVRLVIHRLPSLGEVWMVEGRTMPDGEEGGGCSNCTPHVGQIRVGSCFSDLHIFGCPKLKVGQYLHLLVQRLLSSQLSEKLLQSPCQCQGSSSSYSFCHLKKLELQGMTGSGRGWKLPRHLMALESLELYHSDVLTELPESLQSLTSLRSLDVSAFSTIRMLPEGVGELRSLQELTIRDCCSLSTLPQSMGHLTSLQVLKIQECNALQQLPQSMCGLTFLKELDIWKCPSLTSLPQGIKDLTSLQRLEILYCPGLTSLPQGIKGLTSLQELQISSCPGLTSLPQGIKGLVALQILDIWNCPGLTSLPQGIKGLTSLQRLYIWMCPGLTSLPQEIKGLTSLQRLDIWVCPDLARRCERGKGEDWHLISHIPHLMIR